MNALDLAELEKFLTFSQNAGTVRRYVRDIDKSEKLISSVLELANFANIRGYQLPNYYMTDCQQPYYVLLNVATDRFAFIEMLMDYKSRIKSV